MLIDDRRSSVALPETPLLAVLPGTGGLTRVTDKRKVRRDLADVFCSTEEGVRGRRAVEWRLVDEAVPPSAWEKRVRERAREFAARTDRPKDAKGVALTPLDRRFEGDDAVLYSSVRLEFDRGAGRATLTVLAPQDAPPASPECGEGRRLLAAPHGARAGRRDPPPPRQRARARPPRAAHRGRRGCRARPRRLPGTAQGRLVHPRGAPQPQARAEAPRRHLAQHGRADRARKLLRRHPGRARLRRRPLGHVHRRARGRQPQARRAHPLGA